MIDFGRQKNKTFTSKSSSLTHGMKIILLCYNFSGGDFLLARLSKHEISVADHVASSQAQYHSEQPLIITR